MEAAPTSAHWLFQLTALCRSDAEQLQRHYQDCLHRKRSFVQWLVLEQQVNEFALAKQLAQLFKLHFFDLSQWQPQALALQPKIADIDIDYLLLFEKEACLYIAIYDPTAVAALDSLKQKMTSNVEYVLVNLTAFQQAMQKIGTTNANSASQALSSAKINKTSEADSHTLIGYLDSILLQAIQQNASDIHFEPYQQQYRIRFRIDGMLQCIDQPELSLASQISVRLKLMAQLNIAEKRLPQDGRFQFVNDDVAVDIRISTLATLYGEKIVLRLLDTSAQLIQLLQLGLVQTQQQQLLDALNHPQGLILVTGPTGSGKTVSLYAALNYLNHHFRNISTVEDPVEIELSGINQVHVQPKIGLDFAQVLRALLRQDPDVIMVGEIRDKETAEIAIRAAQTGHLVLSTLHTNSTIETFSRLQQMGIADYHLCSAVKLVIAQRLLRRLCPLCKQAVEFNARQFKTRHKHQTNNKHQTDNKYHIDSQHQADNRFEADSESEIGHRSQANTKDPVTTRNKLKQIYQAIGCDHCHSGYKGRLAIYELLPMTNELQLKFQIKTGLHQQIEQYRNQHQIPSLWQMGMQRVIAGDTSLEEMYRVLGLNAGEVFDDQQQTKQ